jgi:hypothetical protein
MGEFIRKYYCESGAYMLLYSPAERKRQLTRCLRIFHNFLGAGGALAGCFNVFSERIIFVEIPAAI